MLFTDRELSLFAVSPKVRGDVVYLVWKRDEAEPELWRYSGMDSRSFVNLVDFFRWCLAPVVGSVTNERT